MSTVSVKMLVEVIGDATNASKKIVCVINGSNRFPIHSCKASTAIGEFGGKAEEVDVVELMYKGDDFTSCEQAVKYIHNHLSTKQINYPLIIRAAGFNKVVEIKTTEDTIELICE